MQVYGYGVTEKGSNFVPVVFDRTDLRAGEVAIDITHCGVCHSDLHQVDNDWGNTNYPCVPGHEIAGVVTAIGDGVKKFKVGDRVGVGCMIDSCQECESCRNNDEQYCSGPKSCTLTYNGTKAGDGSNTYGGYTDSIIVREEFVLKVPDAISNEVVGPILCAGITTYQPMKHFGLKKGDTLGVAGIGGLGHIAIQIGKALGARVVALTTSPGKRDEIMKLGADDVLITTDAEAMANAAQSLDMMVNTIPVKHDINPYVTLMKPNSMLLLVGNMNGFDNVESGPLVFNRIGIAGSLIGGIKDTQEILDLCAKHDIAPLTKVVTIQEIDAIYDELRNGNPRYRHVIDMKSLKDDADGKGKAREIASPTRGEVVGRAA
ncbi:Zn-dependent alcohol dehydrogenase [Fulvimarina pelagi HTCC2506]|uniref:Zn-dependent alcohol dehydrogenase n=2 Tax=Fulvimarina pelagi TaxID=217511 RepID=Q0G0A8_9HYPH|nr:NAD(P)-dependent alcohol dehydrogenase [Fulvimarina pelagi]EAU40685.1 Zn-dependent alcohol dehydrogenase [Fulvimarina pelagi HTCC2506]BAT31228.1 Zn-dependent alcohol dehydrogenase [Fulvimarina pelagi]